MLDRLRRRLGLLQERERPDSAPPLGGLLTRIRGLEPGDIAIDCGANVGLVTQAMADSGATVHAFEPNPSAFSVLRQKMADRPNVTLHNAAVSTHDGTVRLYRHESAHEDPVHWSVGSSVIEDKVNVDRESYDDVQAIDLDRFLGDLGRPVALMKMDIEGAEVAVLGKLIQSGRIRGIGTVLVETHEAKIPSLREPTAELRGWIEREGLDNVKLDWI
ncbi:methyltransferase, FkbM family [Rhodospira trueperi]|uniref:Methyltransferase, FkbM family n=2 Tax=Rhodospira trueperi TaxID=69960 RepID=A0A1G7GQL0_9PROT|nr:methyltransferase, FkbM family [Rhodospira trueperi]